MALTETKIDFLKDLQLPEDYSSSVLDQLVETDQKYLKDLKINVKNVLTSESFTLKEAYLIAYAIAVNEKNNVLKSAFAKIAAQNQATEQEIAESAACASALSVNNVFYRFKHFVKSTNENYQTMPAGIKMNLMMSPILGKPLFELISLAVSAVNGCEDCVKSHEASLIRLEVSEKKIFDAIRLAAVIKGLSSVIY